MRRRPRKHNYMELYKEKHKRGSNDGRVVDLSFLNVSTNMANPDPESPSKIIYDKNDPSGSLLPIIFPEPRAYECEFVKDGITYKGCTPFSLSNPTQAAGTLERVNSNSYFIYVVKPQDNIINDLNRRGIQIFSDNRPLTSVIHTTRTSNNNYRTHTYVYVYANRRDAIGVYNPNDPNILPSS